MKFTRQFFYPLKHYLLNIFALYWYALANANAHPEGAISMAGIARKWSQNGCPHEFIKGSPKFDAARHKVAIAYGGSP